MTEPKKQRGEERLVVESTQERVRRAPATVDRIEPPRPEDWTGEHARPADLGEGSGLLKLGEDSTLETVSRARRGRRAPREQKLRLAVAASLMLLLLVLFFDAALQSVARLASGSEPRWREIEIAVTSQPRGARVFIEDAPRGQAPLVARERCRGRVVHVRVTAPGYSNWYWNGVCPRDRLALSARLQRPTP